MSQFDSSTANRPFTPEGRIAAIPAQSAQSCELVIQALADELAYVRSVLYMAAELLTLNHQSDKEPEEDAYWGAWNKSGEFLENLQRDWPHLDIQT